MSTLKLNLCGNSEPLVSYLKNFAKIRNSLLLEIDTEIKAFVAKIFTMDRSAIRFSSITFDECSISIVSDNNKERGSKRIKAGILIQLNKLIKILERFGSDVDKEGKSNFIIRIDYDVMSNNGEDDYVATTIAFENDQLRMKMDGFKVSELIYLDDEKFKNDIFNVEDPVSLTLTPDIISSVIKTTDIIKVDPHADIMCFYVEGKDVFICDKQLDITSTNEEPNFVYKIGTLETEPGYPIKANILREKFIQMMDRVSCNYKFILGHRMGAGGEYVVDRILMDSENGSTKVVIAIQNI